MPYTKSPILEVQKTPSMVNNKYSTSSYIMFKLWEPKDKEKLLKKKKKTREEIITYRGARIINTMDFSFESKKARREWSKYIVLNQKKIYQSRILYPLEVSSAVKNNKDFAKQTKIERIHCFQTWYSRNVQGNFG